MISIETYPTEYEFLPIELLVFFSETNNGTGGKRKTRTVFEFCEYYKEKYKTKELPQPRIVSTICDKLVEKDKMSVFNKGGFDNLENSYLCILKDKSFINKPILFNLRNKQLSCEIYGFKYIYDYYQKYVLPILHIDKENDMSIGSSILFKGGILTAKHCIENAEKIAIQTINPEHLKNAKYYTFNKESMDLIFIKLPNDIPDSIYFSEDACLLEEVIALGYPKVPGFHNFLTAEKALVSSRFTATKGSVTAVAEDIWIREKLILITAKIQGGNSGGPIINNNGKVVGIASSLATGEGKYDDLGYGTVIPIKFGNEIIENMEKEFDTAKIEFIEFIE